MKYLLICLVILLLALSACNPSEEGQNQQNNQQNDNDNDQAPADSNDDDADDDADDDSDSTDDANMGSDDDSDSNAIIDFFKKKGTLTYMVEYDMQNTGMPEANGVMTQYVKGIDKLRMDTEFQGAETRTFILDEAFYACNTLQGDWSCMKIDDGMSESDELQSDIEENPADYDVSVLAPKTVAGTVTACFRVTVDDGNVDYCFSPEGIPLYIEMNTASGTIIMEANKYSTKVSNSDFDLPAEPTDMADLMNGMPDMDDFEIPDY